VADKAYDSDTLRDFISRHENRVCYSSKIYRHIVDKAGQQLLDDADAVAVLLERSHMAARHPEQSTKVPVDRDNVLYRRLGRRLSGGCSIN
jgi:hypothetical protein